MRTRLLITLLLPALLVVAAGAALAEEDAAAPALADMNAKDLYRNACKPCHTADADAGEYTPMSLIGEQWEEFFDGLLAETHADATLPGDGTTPLLEALDEELIGKLREFCVDHAADSEQPMTCG